MFKIFKTARHSHRPSAPSTANSTAMATVIAIAMTTLGGCSTDSELSFVLPQQLGLEQLPAEAQQRLRATATIPGVLNAAELTIDLKAGKASGSFTVADENVEAAPLQVDFFSAVDSISPEILIARTSGTITIKKGKENSAKLGDVVSDGDVIFDLNRNGRSNLEDLIDGFDPQPGPQPIDISPKTISFAAGVEVGGFTRSFFVVENTSEESVDLDLDVRLAPGVTLSPLSGLFDTSASAATTHQNIVLPAGGEEVFALTFAPANPLFLLGSVSVGTTKQNSGVEHGTLMRLLGNPQGAIPQPPPGYLIPTPPDGTTVGGYTGTVLPYPVQSLFSRAPNITEVAEIDAGAIGDYDIDAAYLVAVPPRHRFAAVFDGLSSDIDLYLFELDEDFQPISAEPISSSTHAGTSGESVEYDATAEREETRLLLLAFDGITTAELVDVPGGQATPEGGGVTQTALFSVPELLQPCERDDNFELIDAACLEPITSQQVCPNFYSAALACGSARAATQFTLRGQNIQAGAVVRVGENIAVCTVVETLETHEEIHCLAPPSNSDPSASPLATVVLTNPDGQTVTLADGFTYFPQAPTLFSVLPGTGPTTGGMTATVQGTGFFTKDGIEPSVTINGVNAAGVEWLSPTQIRFVVPACDTCSDGDRVDVEVGNPDDQVGTLIGGFEYRTPAGPAPVAVSLSPAQGPTKGGLSVTLSGSNLTNETLVRVGGALGAGVTFVSATELTFVTPIGVPGFADVEVINSDGQTGRLRGGFEYLIPNPAITNLSIGRGPEIGGTSLFISGTDFQTGAQVMFGSTSALQTTV